MNTFPQFTHLPSLRLHTYTRALSHAAGRRTTMQSIHCSKLSKRATDNNRSSIQDAVMLHDSEMYAKNGKRRKQGEQSISGEELDDDATMKGEGMPDMHVYLWRGLCRVAVSAGRCCCSMCMLREIKERSKGHRGRCRPACWRRPHCTR